MKTSTLLLIMMMAGMASAQTFSWADQFGGTLPDRVVSSVTDDAGNSYITGRFEGTFDADPGPGITALTSAGGSDIFISKITPTGTLVWVRQIGGSGTYTGESGTGIAVGASGAIYITGVFLGTVDFDPDATEFVMESTAPLYESCTLWADVFVLKLTADGDFVWAKKVGGNGNDEAAAIVLSSQEEVYVAGEYVSEGNGPVDMDPGEGTFYLTAISGSAAFLLKLNTDGGFMWVKQWYSTGISAGGCGLRDALVHPKGLSLDQSGNILCTGDFLSTVDWDPNAGVYIIQNNLGNSAYVLKLSAAGDLVWVKHLYNQGGHAYGKDIVVGANGNIYSAGLFDATIDFDPGTGTKNLKAPGGAGANGIGPSDAYVWVLNAAGSYVWAGQIGGNTGDAAAALDLDAAGNIYVTGTFTGTADMNPSSAKNTLKSAGNTDIFICKLTGTGGYTWAVRLGGTLYDWVASVDIDANNNILTSGYFEGQADFNPASQNYYLTSYGGVDGFLLKLTQSGGGNLARPWNDDIQVLEANVFPNPTSSILNVGFARDAESVHLRIYDLQGQLMLEKDNVTGRSVSVDVSGIPAGMYLMSIKDDVKTTVLPFVKTD